MRPKKVVQLQPRWFCPSLPCGEFRPVDLVDADPSLARRTNALTRHSDIVPAPALAKSRDTVAGCTLKSLAASAAVLVPVDWVGALAAALRCGPAYGQHPIQPLFSRAVLLFQTQQMLRPSASSCVLEQCWISAKEA